MISSCGYPNNAETCRLVNEMTPAASMMIMASGAASSALRASSGGAVRIGTRPPTRGAIPAALPVYPRYLRANSPYHSGMQGSGNANWRLLKSVARRAMRERGLLPDFSAAAVTQARSIAAPAAAEGPGIRRSAHSAVGVDRQRRFARSRSAVGGAAARRRGREDSGGDCRRRRRRPRGARRSTIMPAATPPLSTRFRQIFPMLPEKLSTDLTSLAEGQDRLAIVVDMTVDAARRRRQASDIYRALVRNQAKLAYNGVGAWLAGERTRAGSTGRGCGTRSAAAHSGPDRAGAARPCGTPTAH